MEIVLEFKKKSQSSTCLFHVCVGCFGGFYGHCEIKKTVTFTVGAFHCCAR